MRSWAATGNDLLNAIDVKERMEYAGGIKNTKVAVVEIVLDQGRHFIIEKNSTPFVIFSIGHLGKTNVPNVSSLRSIRYSPNNMKVFKASSIGTGIAIPYKQIDFETNMRIVSPFGYSIDRQQSNTVAKEKNTFTFPSKLNLV